MQTYITILRGINVSGHKKIKMNDLKELLKTLNFKNIQTYIQSGNIIFQSMETEPTKLVRNIEEAISGKYNFDVPVFILTRHELENIISNNPFLKARAIDTDKLHVTFLSSTPQQENIEKMGAHNYEPDKFRIMKNVVYIYCSNGYGNTKLSNNFLENKLRTTATTRNWKTVNVLAKMSFL